MLTSDGNKRSQDSSAQPSHNRKRFCRHNSTSTCQYPAVAGPKILKSAQGMREQAPSNSSTTHSRSTATACGTSDYSPALHPQPSTCPSSSSSATEAHDDSPVCWICLDHSSSPTSDKTLHSMPCNCKTRYAHPTCLARWQLQSAGTKRETHCDFCQQELPDWKKVITVPEPVAQQGIQAPAVMTVSFNGRTFFFHVKPGPDGYRQFTADVKAAFTLPDDCDLNITFTCDEPAAPVGPQGPPQGSLLTLQGPGSYDAAVHCAHISAAKRLAMRQAGLLRPEVQPKAAMPVDGRLLSTGSPRGPVTRSQMP